jgi:uroporphyrinogen-III synthase
MPVVVLTRTQEDNADLILDLKDSGTDFFSFPLLDFARPNSYEDLDRAIRSNHQYDWIFFLSKKSALSFFDRVIELGGHLFHLSPHIKIACVGKSTSRFVSDEIGFPVDFVPSQFNADTLLSEFVDKFANEGWSNGLEPKKILIPRNADLDDDLTDKIQSQFVIDICPAYRCLPSRPSSSKIQELQKLIDSHKEIYISLASSQTAKNFSELAPKLNCHDGVKILSIGPKTSETIKELLPDFELITSFKPCFKTMIKLANNGK